MTRSPRLTPRNSSSLPLSYLPTNQSIISDSRLTTGGIGIYIFLVFPIKVTFFSTNVRNL